MDSAVVGRALGGASPVTVTGDHAMSGVALTTVT